MAPKSKSSLTGQTLKQGTLSFASTKRGATAAGKSNTPKASPSILSVKPSEARKEKGSRTASLDSTISINSSSRFETTDDDVVQVSVPAGMRSFKRRKTDSGSVKAIKGSIKTKAPANDSNSSSSEEEEEPLDLDVLEKNPQVRSLFRQAKLCMGHAPPVHAEKQTKVHHILRVFDTSYEYGPCVGMTRLERWERAHALGLNPPPAIRDILMSEQAKKNDTFKQCVFYDEL